MYIKILILFKSYDHRWVKMQLFSKFGTSDYSLYDCDFDGQAGWNPCPALVSSVQT